MDGKNLKRTEKPNPPMVANFQRLTFVPWCLGGKIPSASLGALVANFQRLTLVPWWQNPQRFTWCLVGEFSAFHFVPWCLGGKIPSASLGALVANFQRLTFVSSCLRGQNSEQLESPAAPPPPSSGAHCY
ncbi:MAG: hypothetical protein RLZZ519_2178 [Bacteroidota bacterium]